MKINPFILSLISVVLLTLSGCEKSFDQLEKDNNRAVHGRSSFSPKYDGNDRFLIRCFSTFDLEKSAYARPNNGRMISAIYS